MSETDQSGAGYKRPPAGSRFKTGQSGNPKGRPKGGRNLKTDLSAMLNKRVTIREDGELRHVSRQEAMLLSLFDKALRGDVRAAGQIITMLMKLDVATAHQSSGPPPVTDHDRAIVEAFLRRNSRPIQGADA